MAPQTPLYCSVEGCLSSRCTPGVRFFCFPSQKERCLAWLKFCGDDGLMQNWEVKMKKNAGRYKVCSLHFKRENFMNVHMDKLVRGVVPSLNGPPTMMEYAAMSPTVAISVHSASPSSYAESSPSSSPHLPSTIPNPNLTPCTSSFPSTSFIKLHPGPSHAAFVPSTVCTSTNLPSTSYVSVASDDLVSATTFHSNIVRKTESSCKKNGLSLSRIHILKQSYCTPCKQKDLEIKRLRATNHKLKQLLQSMRRSLDNQQSTIVDTRMSSDMFTNEDS